MLRRSFTSGLTMLVGLAPALAVETNTFSPAGVSPNPALPATFSNVFTVGSAEDIARLIIDLTYQGSNLDFSGYPHGMYRRRSEAMLRPFMEALVFHRDARNIVLNADVVRAFLSLPNMVSLTEPKDYPATPEHISTEMRAYFTSIPGYVQGRSAYRQAQTTLDQHCYTTLPFEVALKNIEESGLRLA